MLTRPQAKELRDSLIERSRDWSHLSIASLNHRPVCGPGVRLAPQGPVLGSILSPLRGLAICRTAGDNCPSLLLGVSDAHLIPPEADDAVVAAQCLLALDAGRRRHELCEAVVHPSAFVFSNAPKQV